MAIKFSRTPFTPLYGDVLRYLDRRGLPSVSNIFGDYKGATNPYLIDFDEEETTTKPIDQIRMPAAPLNQRRDSGGGPSPRGIGSFGNLDPNSVKYFNLNGKIVKGYRNLSSGLYQTEEGKNIIGAEEAGISAAGAFPGQGYIPGHPFSKGYQGLALKAAEDARKAAQIKAAEEAAAAAREQAAAEAAKREAQRKQIQDLQKKIDQGQYGGGGGGPGSTTQFGKTTTPYGGGPGGLHSGGGGGGSKSSSKNSSQPGGGFNSLGFSDIRLKDNIELIGKSPSNINIYKFNYKNNPAIYQGVMAHEVPWASVRHNNGYMMVDYNKVDVEFKKL